MDKTVPIKELKNIVAFSDLVNSSDGPVVVTRNGKGAFAALSLEQLDALRLEAMRGRLYQLVEEAERDVRDGRVVEHGDSMAHVRERYGL